MYVHVQTITMKELPSMRHLSVTAYNNNNKLFKVPCQSGKSVLDAVNENCADPKKEGIPYICETGACRGCTVKVLGRGSELLDPPTRLEQRALQVGKTTISKGYRLACLCKFRKE
jgi:ferredoxin